MGKKIKIAILMLGIYLLVFGIGFKSGNMYFRMQKRIQLEKIELPTPATPPPPYYIIEKTNYGSYTVSTFNKATNEEVIILILMNEKLRPLLKLRDLQIYKSTGERIY